MVSSPSTLCNLVELLEDGRAFHEKAIRSSAGDFRKWHEEKAQCYVSMLAEIRRWKDGAQLNHSQPIDAAATESGIAEGSDGFTALLDRISRMHHAITSARRPVLTRAVTDVRHLQCHLSASDSQGGNNP